MKSKDQQLLEEAYAQISSTNTKLKEKLHDLYDAFLKPPYYSTRGKGYIDDDAIDDVISSLTSRASFKNQTGPIFGAHGYIKIATDSDLKNYLNFLTQVKQVIDDIRTNYSQGKDKMIPANESRSGYIIYVYIPSQRQYRYWTWIKGTKQLVMKVDKDF